GRIDIPVAGQVIDGLLLPIAGWVVGQAGPVSTVELIWEEVHLPLRHMTLAQPRPDVVRTFPDWQHTANSGFYDYVNVIGLPDRFKLSLRGFYPDGASSMLGTIEVERSPISPPPHSDKLLQPILVSALARSGTTWLMHLLSTHPCVSVYPQYPYEMHAAGYWWHLCRVSTNPVQLYGLYHPDLFWFNLEQVGCPPYFMPVTESQPGMTEWFCEEHIQAVIVCCQAMIDQIYRRVAGLKAAESTDLRYFAEKQPVPAYAWLAWELYPGAREIFLVRDFRDVFSSILAFNRKRQVITFGRENFDDDATFAEWLAGRAMNLWANWQARSGRALLVRYEDLVRSPIHELQRILDYLGLHSSQAAAQDLLDRASQSEAILLNHRTSQDALQSVGRWRYDLPPDLQNTAERVFSDALSAFGYA
ncbi:MAG: sulfotransferase family protein, partial [Anaerolineae bacterium]